MLGCLGYIGSSLPQNNMPSLYSIKCLSCFLDISAPCAVKFKCHVGHLSKFDIITSFLHL